MPTKLILFGVFSALTGSAFAADSLHFDDPGSNIWWNNYESVYVSPYTATDTTQHKALSLYCLDFNHNISTGTTWTADIVPLTAAYQSNLYYSSNVPANWKEYDVNLVTSAGTGTISMSVSGPPPNPTPFNRYLEAAYLFTQSRNAQADAQLHPANAAQDAILQQQYNVAAWTLFISEPPESIAGFVGAVNSSGYANAVYNNVQLAQTAVASGSFSAGGWYAVTPDPKTGSNLTQEFLVYRPSGDLNPTVPSVPEPSAVLLFGGVIAILVMTRSRKPRQQNG